jgi:hypothetical protein
LVQEIENFKLPEECRWDKNRDSHAATRRGVFECPKMVWMWKFNAWKFSISILYMAISSVD